MGATHEGVYLFLLFSFDYYYNLFFWWGLDCCFADFRSIHVDDLEQVVEENSSTLCLPVNAGHPIPPPLLADDLAQIART